MSIDHEAVKRLAYQVDRLWNEYTLVAGGSDESILARAYLDLSSQLDAVKKDAERINERYSQAQNLGLITVHDEEMIDAALAKENEGA